MVTGSFLSKATDRASLQWRKSPAWQTRLWEKKTAFFLNKYSVSKLGTIKMTWKSYTLIPNIPALSKITLECFLGGNILYIFEAQKHHMHYFLVSPCFQGGAFSINPNLILCLSQLILIDLELLPKISPTFSIGKVATIRVVRKTMSQY